MLVGLSCIFYLETTLNGYLIEFIVFILLHEKMACRAYKYVESFPKKWFEEAICLFLLSGY